MCKYSNVRVIMYHRCNLYRYYITKSMSQQKDLNWSKVRDGGNCDKTFPFTTQSTSSCATIRINVHNCILTDAWRLLAESIELVIYVTCYTVHETGISKAYLPTICCLSSYFVHSTKVSPLSYLT